MTADSGDLGFRALADASLPCGGYTPLGAVVVPFGEKPVIVPLIPLCDAPLILVLAGGPLKHGSDPALLAFADHLIDVPDVLAVLIVAHSVHLLLPLLLPAAVLLPLEHLNLKVHDRFGGVLVHGTLRGFNSGYLRVGRAGLRLVFYYFESIVTRKLIASKSLSVAFQMLPLYSFIEMSNTKRLKKRKKVQLLFLSILIVLFGFQ